MNQKDILLDIEIRAKRLSLSMRSLCEKARVHPTTFSKWKAGVDARTSGIARLQTVLNEMENTA